MDLEALRIALARKNLSQIAVARALGVDHGTFSRWKRWYPVPKRYRSKLAAILGVSENKLFPENGDASNKRNA